MDNITKLQEQVEALRSEIADLDALDTPTEEQAARFDAALSEFDEAKAAYDVAAERAAKVEAIRTAAIAAPHAREEGFSVPNINTKSDPFENLDGLRYAGPMDEDVIARAITAISDTKYVGGMSDRTRESAIEKIESIPGVARMALALGSPAYMSAFRSWLSSGGAPVYTQDEANAVRAALSLTGANGGFALPTLLDPTLIKTGTAVKNPIRRIARVETGTQNKWNGVSVGNVTTAWKSEGSAFTEGSPTMSNPSVTAFNLTAYLTASYEIFEDSNLQSQMPGLIAEAFDFAESTAFVSGNGTSAPLGVVTAISATAGSTVTATTRGSFTSASAADVFAVLNAVTPRYEETSTWIANKAIFNTIRQMSTGSNGSLFWTDLNSSTPPSLLGSPIASSSDMAAATTSGNVLAILGDFSQYLVYDRIGTALEYIQNVVDGSGIPTGQRGLVAHKRVGGGVTDVNAFRFLKA